MFLGTVNNPHLASIDLVYVMLDLVPCVADLKDTHSFFYAFEMNWINFIFIQ